MDHHEKMSEADKNMDDVMLPGFRFHPTDEELVGFYLKRKIEQRSLPIELIKQVDIYKFDPWDLPKLAATGEKEWYFYCPRDRKYRNSARPNRVTGAGFWKATGTDRPIYSSEGTKCIGLKKSLVFYRGRAAKGIKTDWMMHEFRLPSTPASTDHSPTPPKKLFDKNLPANDSWAICRIFKKTNSMAHRALTYPWIAPLAETIPIEAFARGPALNSAHFSPENNTAISSPTTETGSARTQLCSNPTDFQTISAMNFASLNIPSCKIFSSMACGSSPFMNSSIDLISNFMLSSPETTKSTLDMSPPSSLFHPSPSLVNGDEQVNKTPESIEFEGSKEQFHSFSLGSSQDVQIDSQENDNQWGSMRSLGFPFSFSPTAADAWKPSLLWDSPPCPSEISTNYSTTKCYT